MHRLAYTLTALTLLAVALAAPSPAPAAAPSLIGVFYNQHPSVRAGGPATLGDLAGDAGYLDFTQMAGDSRVICGAGDFSGTRAGEQLLASFVSRDLDRGCGFDHGGIFTITATVGLDDLHVAGDYVAKNADGSSMIESTGIFEVWANGTAPLTTRYRGWFFNQTAGVSGTAVLDLAVGDRALFGKMNFTGTPGDTILCGAGLLTGARHDSGALEWSFVSADADLGCGFDHGMRFIVDAQRSPDGASVTGEYFLGDSRTGIFELRRASTTFLPIVTR